MIKINKSCQPGLYWTITKVGYGVMAETKEELLWDITKNTNREIEDDLSEKLFRFVEKRFRIK